jgi:hypothetical protein
MKIYLAMSASALFGLCFALPFGHGYLASLMCCVICLTLFKLLP